MHAFPGRPQPPQCSSSTHQGWRTCSRGKSISDTTIHATDLSCRCRGLWLLHSDFPGLDFSILRNEMWGAKQGEVAAFTGFLAIPRVLIDALSPPSGEILSTRVSSLHRRDEQICMRGGKKEEGPDGRVDAGLLDLHVVPVCHEHVSRSSLGGHLDRLAQSIQRDSEMKGWAFNQIPRFRGGRDSGVGGLEGQDSGALTHLCMVSYSMSSQAMICDAARVRSPTHTA